MRFCLLYKTLSLFTFLTLTLFKRWALYACVYEVPQLLTYTQICGEKLELLQFLIWSSHDSPTLTE